MFYHKFYRMFYRSLPLYQLLYTEGYRFLYKNIAVFFQLCYDVFDFFKQTFSGNGMQSFRKDFL